GSASVDDTYDDSGDSQFSGDETHSGPLTNQPPNFGTATLFFDLKKCKYQLVVAFGVATTVSGTFDAGSQSTVSGTVYSDRNHIPQNLSVVGGDGPPAYHDCPGNPLASGHTCYQFGTGVIGLCNTSDVGTNHCPPPPVGNAHFIWSLKPKK
ncbi:MAG: hypothetical protein ACJ76X_03845, partial [Solirubrobacteraceae bacterium]